MRLALVIALTQDRRTLGRVLTPLLPSSEAIQYVKTAISAGQIPDARFPIVQAISLETVLREHRFRPTSGDLAQAIDRAQNEAVVLDDDLQKQIADLTAKLADSEAGIAHLTARLAESEQAPNEVSRLQDQIRCLQGVLQASVSEVTSSRTAQTDAEQAAKSSAARITELESQLESQKFAKPKK